MKHPIASILPILIAAVLFAFKPMAAFAVSAPTLAATADATTQTLTGYVQFCGAGRSILALDAYGKVKAVVASPGHQSRAGYSWSISVTDGTAVVKNVQDKLVTYLGYADGKLTASSTATTFGWAVNTYYKDAAVGTRYQLLLPGSTTDAVGVKNGQLTVVPANSRYALLLVTQSVAGADVPEFSTDDAPHYYNIGTHWGSDSDKDFLYANNEKVMVSGKANWPNADYQWMVSETETGDVVLKNKAGYYLAQASAAAGYTPTTDASQAATLQMVDAVDQGRVTKGTNNTSPIDNQRWPAFWQLYNPAYDTYFFEGNEKQMGGTSNRLYTNHGSETSAEYVGKYLSAWNRLRFLDTERRYVQFSAMGRYVLTEQGSNVEAIHVDAAEASPSATRWAVIPWESAQVLQDAAGNYLQVDAKTGTFSVVTDVANATQINAEANNYYLDGPDRLCLTLAADATKALGVKNGVLTLVPVHSRYSVACLADEVKGTDGPLLSDAKSRTTYNLTLHYGAETNRFDVFASSTKASFTKGASSANLASNAYRWHLTEANALGDVLLQNEDGLYLQQTKTGAAYTATANRADASVMRLYENVDGGNVMWTEGTDKDGLQSVDGADWSAFWQLKSVKATFLYTGWGGDMGAPTSQMPHCYGINQAGFANNRLLFNDAQTITLSGDVSGYVQFSGVGRTILSENGEGRVLVAVADAGSPADKGTQWTVKATDDGTVTLVSGNGRWLCYVSGAFSTTTQQSLATRFGWEQNAYTPDVVNRWQLLLPGDDGYAVGVRYGELTRVPAHSRYAMIYMADAIDGADQPETSSVQSQHYYKINIAWGHNAADKDCLYADNTGVNTTENNGTATDADRYKWMLVEANERGDVKLQNKAGYYLTQTDINVAYTATTDETKAVVFQLVEAVDQGQVWWNQNGGEYVKEQYWPSFWQLRNTSNGTYLFEGNENKMGGLSNPAGRYDYGNNGQLGRYLFASNRVRFLDTKEVSEEMNYVHFSAVGRYVLALDADNAPVAAHVDAATTTPSCVQWQMVARANGYVMKNNAGTYLVADAPKGTFAVTAELNDATLWTVEGNTYYADGAQRKCIALADDADRALGVKNGTLALVPAHSRYSVVRFAADVLGTDGPVLTGDARMVSYAMAIYYRQETGANYVFTREASPTVTVVNKDYDLTAPAYRWYLTDENEMGDVKLKNGEGYYLKQSSSTSVYERTDNPDEAAVMRLYENVDGGTVTTWVSADNCPHAWGNFWQLKAVDASFFFVGDKGFMGGNSVSYSGANTFAFCNNRLQFTDPQEEDNFNSTYYVHFTGMGRIVLQAGEADASGVPVLTAAHVEEGTAQPEGTGYRWQVRKEGGKKYLHVADEELYLTLGTDAEGHAVPALTADFADAAPLVFSTNNYYGSAHLRRYNVAVEADTTLVLGVTDEGLGWVKPHSRYSVIYLATVGVLGTDRPMMSVGIADLSYWYNLNYWYGMESENNLLESTKANPYALYTRGEQPTVAYSNTRQNLKTDAYLWRFIVANDLGDVYVQNREGYYLRQSSRNNYYERTADVAQASVLRPFEAVDGGQVYGYWDSDKALYPATGHFWPDFWQFRNMDAGNGTFAFIGWDNQFGGMASKLVTSMPAYKGIGSYGFANNRFQLVLQYSPRDMWRGYLLFSATGPYPLVVGADGTPRAVTGLTDLKDKGAYWNLIAKDNKYGVLRNGNGLYVTCTGEDATATFGTSADEADAYRFLVAENHYQNNNTTRYELQNADGTLALSADMSSRSSTGSLSWGAPGTRYSVLRFTDYVAGPVMPDVNAKKQRLKAYQLYTAESSKHYKLTDGGAEGSVVGTELLDEDYTRTTDDAYMQDNVKYIWLAEAVMTDGAYIGDCVVRSMRGHYLSYDAASGKFITTADASRAATMRLVENNQVNSAWQLQLVGQNDADGQWVSYVDDNTDMMMLATDGTTTFNLSTPNNANNYLKVDLVDIYPEFSIDGDKEAYLGMMFVHLDGTPSIERTGEDGVDANGTNTIEQHVTWSIIGDFDDFKIRNFNGQYLVCDLATKSFRLTSDKAEATSFTMLQNLLKANDHLTWCVCPNVNGTLPSAPQCIWRNADGTLTLSDYGSTLRAPETSIYFTRNTSVTYTAPDYKGDPTFYYVEFPAVKSTRGEDIYLTGTSNGEMTAIGEAKEQNNVSTTTKVEFLNKQLWAYVGTSHDFVLMSRDSTYLAWDADAARFTTVLHVADAAHFEQHYDGNSDQLRRIQYLGTGADDPLYGHYLQVEGTAADGYYVTLQADDAQSTRPERWTVSDPEYYTKFHILHKRSWFVKQLADAGDVSTAPEFIDADTDGWDQHPTAGVKQQRTNVYRVDQYVKDGTYRYLYLPSHMRKSGGSSAGASRVRAYQRFYQYDTDGRLNRYRIILKRKSRRTYANGVVMGADLKLNNYFGAFVGEEVTFQMPVLTPERYRYTMGIDASYYTDFVDYFGDNSLPYDVEKAANTVHVPDNQDLIEPTLGSRYLYVVHNAREMADSMLAFPAGGDKWLEQYTITFPKKKVGLKNCTVPLNHMLQNYWFYNGDVTGLGNDEAGRLARNHLLQYPQLYKYLDFVVDNNTAGIALEYPGATASSTDGTVTVNGVAVDDPYPIDLAPRKWTDLGEKRYIRFLYPKANADGTPADGGATMALPDEMGCALGDKAVLKVYLTDGQGHRLYNLARITLNFEEGTEPRPYTEVLGYADSKTSSATTTEALRKARTSADRSQVVQRLFKDVRSPQALYVTYGHPRASIDFEYTTFRPFTTPPFGTSVVAGGPSLIRWAPSTEFYNSYGVPLDYDHTNYAFEPFSTNGSYVENSWGSYSVNRELQTTWSTSSDTRYHPVRTLYKHYFPDQNYDDANDAFLYVDVSDESGSICTLRSNGNLCKGSRLYFSAWVGSPNLYKNDEGKVMSQPANVILIVKGVKVDPETKEETSDVLYRYCPGPIYDWARKADGTLLKHGKGEEGIWQQIFFSFVNNRQDTYDYFSLTVDNASTNSNGADLLLDEVEMYAMKPSVLMERTTPVCGQSMTLAKLTCDYEGLLNSLSLTEGEKPTGGTPRMWYCLLNKEIYDAELAKAAKPTSDDVHRAFDAALVGDPTVYTGAERAFRNVEFSTTYDDLLPFSYKESLTYSGENALVRRETDSKGERHLIITDKVTGSNLQPYQKYYLVFVPRYGGSTTSSDALIRADNAWQEFQMGDSCCIMSEFETTSAIRFFDDADSSLVSRDNLVTLCANQSINITAQTNGVSINNGQTISLIARYDWWLDLTMKGERQSGSLANAWIDANGNALMVNDGEDAPAGCVSLREALLCLRHHYPDATSIDGIEATSDGNDFYDLTRQMIDGIRSFLIPTGDTYDASNTLVKKGHGAPLHLCSPTLNITIESDGTTDLVGTEHNVTLIPIRPLDNDTVVYCDEPSTLTIQIQGRAPLMLVGFRSAEAGYPSYLTQPSVRTGLDYVRAVSSDSPERTPSTLMRLPLRSISTVSSAAVGVMKIEREGVTFAPVYLVGTNDESMPLYDESSQLQFRVVGVVSDLSALSDASEPAHADIFFLDDFHPREGSTYSLRFGFFEKFPTGHEKTDDEAAVCDGSLVFNLCIVPRYETWTGQAYNADWTNDANWSRASQSDLHREGSGEYTDNAANGTAKGFVPLSFTNVLVGTGTHADFAISPNLYAVEGNAALAADNTLERFLAFNTIDSSPDASSAIRTATDDIEYDLVFGDTGLVENGATARTIACRPFHTYACHDLVLQAGGELAHSERLVSYHNAWMEYALKAGRWYTLGSPFQRMFAGDWYAPTEGGSQLSPYFSSVTYTPAAYDRFSPAVYQRGWDKGKATVYYLENGTGATPLAADVAIRADWSAVYNDVQVQYADGGFSLKANAAGRGGHAYSDLLFRLPKEDDAFDYYKYDDTASGSNRQEVDRQGNTTVNLTARLLTDGLTAEGSEMEQTLTNSVSGHRFFLVGNPFPCGLDMARFFAANTAVFGAEGWKYWMLTADGQTAVMRGPGASGWVTVNGATSGAVVAPGQGFFVEALSSALGTTATGGAEVTVKFTADMMASATESEVSLLSVRSALSSYAAVPPTLRIRASRGGVASEALVVKDATATNRFAEREDMPALVDGALADVPVVYTIADTLATTINRRPSMWRVPLGVTSRSADAVTLTFSGLSTFGETLSLLDEATGEVKPLTLAATGDEVSVEVPGITNGRYWLLTSEPPTADDVLTGGRPVVTVDGSSVCVTSTSAHPLTSVRIVMADGRELYRLAPFQPTLRLKLPLGAYVVEAATDEGQTVAKVTVK